MQNERHLTKSNTNKVLGGVIGGFGEYLGLTADIITIIRIVYALLVMFTGFSILPYIVAYFLMPRSTSYSQQTRMRQDFYQQTPPRKRKDAQPINDDTDSWSDF